MKLSPEIGISLAVLGVATILIGLSALTLGIYGALVFFIFKRGGKVSAREFGMPDLFVGSFFLTWFVALIAQKFAGSESHTVTQSELIAGAYFNVGVVAAIALFLRMRNIRPLRQFGFTQLNPLKAGAIALGLLVAAFPLLGLVSKLTLQALGPDAKKQELVQFFLKASGNSERATVLLTIVIGVVLAPVAEELMFRGYLYGVFKRYAGAAIATILSAGLFAAVHMNLASLPALFVLAVCFTIAYEITGSLLVNITMHALFNLSAFLWMLHLPSSPAQ